ncbi:MAG: cation:proton antiporter [Deltaproteobacteria bacterium]|nr:cation:proton antiporter [Deltaproteobacteria bacterium]
MTESTLLFELILLLALTATGLALFERLRLPAIAGFLVVGALAGPGALGLVADPNRVRALAEIGVIFLLFEIGLELPMERLKDLGRTALIAGGSQVTITLAVVAASAVALGLPPASAFVLGGLVAMSSTALVMRMLSDDGQIDSPQGQLAVSVLVFQDLSIVPLLLAIPFLAADDGSGAGDLALSVMRMVGALVVVLFIVRLGVPRILNRVAEAGSPDLFSLLALLIVLGSAVLAQQLGLTLAVGAFLAGVAATSSPYAQQLFSEVVPLRGVILGVFFTAVGMLFEPRALIDHAPLVGLYLITTIVLKTSVVAVASTLVLGHGLRVAVLAGLALSQTGEFSFVLAEAARSAGLLGETLYQVVLAGSILSLVVSPFILRVSPFVAEALTRWVEGTGDDESVPPPRASEVDERILVFGYGPAGQTLTRLLRAIGAPYLVVDANARAVRRAREHGENIIFGDATRPTVLGRLSVDAARLIVVAISDPLATRRIVSRIRLIAPDTPILARTRFVGEVDLLEAAGASSVVAEEFEGSIEVVARALDLFKIPAGAIARFTEALREEGYGAIRSPAALPMDPWLVELLEEVGTEWIDAPARLAAGTTLASLDVRARTGASVLAVEHDGVSTTNPEPDFPIQPGDRLLVLGNKENLTRLVSLLSATRAPS